MRKIYIVSLALFAVLAFSAVAVGSASATLWLVNGKSPLVATKVTIHGTIILHHKAGSAGNILIECTGLLEGTVGPGASDEITKVFDLSGKEITETGTGIECKVTESDNVFCAAGSKATVNPLHLNWKTELVLSGGSTFDNLEEVSGKGLPGWTSTCLVTVKCEGKDRSKFLSNGTNGAKLKFEAELKASCSDGGEGTLLGEGEVLGATIS